MTENIILEKELEYYSSSGEKLKAYVKVYPSRLIIEKKNELESILIPYINILKLYRDQKWSYLTAGIILGIFSLILFITPPITKSIILETPIKEIIGAFILFFAIACIISWWYYRAFILIINSFGYTTSFSNRKEQPLKELYETLETLRSLHFNEAKSNEC